MVNGVFGGAKNTPPKLQAGLREDDPTMGSSRVCPLQKRDFHKTIGKGGGLPLPNH